MSPLRKLAVAGAVVLTVAVTVVLGALAGIGVWLVAVVLGGTIALLAILAGVGGSQLSIPVHAPRPHIDPVTHLPDLERLRADLIPALEGQRHVLLSYPIDGLKAYNDAYGERCGDALMAWLAAKLCDAVGSRAVVYRAQGAGFAVLAAGREETTDAVRAHGATALFEIGDGFAIWPTVGAAILPEDASTPEEAIESANRRAHSPAAGSAPPHGSPRPPDDPIEALPQGRTRFDVGELAKRVGQRLGVPSARLDDLEVAAHLRDVGNLALPSPILTDPRVPSAQARALIELHTVVGERVIASRFGMENVAALVRASHERWDGTGYPDSLRGEQIPLESRIVFVCSAYQDMTAERPHRRALDGYEALTELARAAGAQFDPRVVQAFTRELAARSDGRARARSVGSGVLSAFRTLGMGDDGAPLRVLVADPDPVSRFLLRKTTGNCGHECVAAPDAAAAWEIYKRALPDAVIAAAEMPGAPGADLLARIRAAGPSTYLMLLAEPVAPDPDGIIDSVIARPIVRRELEIRLSGARQTAALLRPVAAAS